MSIKVYRAFKLRRRDYFWPLVRDIRQQGTKHTQRLLREFYGKVMDAVLPAHPLYQKELASQLKLVREGCDEQKARQYAEQKARLNVAQNILRRGYRISSTSPYRSVFNFDVSVTFREDAKGIYVIPYCEGLLRDALDFLDDDKRLRDYHFQNQTDPPEDVPSRQWRERARVWDGLTDHKRWLDYVSLTICDWNSWWQIDPHFDLSRELHARFFK